MGDRALAIDSPPLVARHSPWLLNPEPAFQLASSGILIRGGGSGRVVPHLIAAYTGPIFFAYSFLGIEYANLHRA